MLALLLVSAHGLSGQPLQTLLNGYTPSFGLLRDTLYLYDSTYIEVRLDQQMIYQRFRSGRVERYPCSTGNPRIKDAIATREGIFAIQWKAQKHFSAQFEVYLNYWMPFDGGIGFHGLAGRSYYKYLGRRRSSHGCVRVSNETGRQIFAQSPSGTVVYVHSGSPARLLLFADSARHDLIPLDETDPELLDRRLTAVMRHEWNDSSLTYRVVIPTRLKFSEQIDVGRVEAQRVTQFPIRLIELHPAPRPSHDDIAPVQARSLLSMLEEDSDEVWQE